MKSLNYKILLERRRDELESTLRESEPHNAFKNNFIARFDRVKKQKAQKQLQNINEALQRFEDGSFGQCQSCGKSLSDQELLIFPERRFCNVCSADFKSNQLPLT